MSRKPSANKSENQYPEIRQISVDLITDPIAPIRGNLTPENVEDLARSIKEIGIIQPVTVRKVGGEYEIVAGHRRLLAAQVAKLAKIPCVIIKAKDEEADIIKLHENIYRENLDPTDEGLFFTSLKERYGWTNDQIADKIHKSVGYVRDRVDIPNYPDGLREALKNKQITFSVAKELVKIDDPVTLKDYTQHATKSGITEKIAAQWTRDFKIRKTYHQAESNATAKSEPAPLAPQSALKCFACQKELDIKFSRIVYLHPDCAKTLEEAVTIP